ncbi:MAG: hypothetical protein GSR74_02615 [Desulfurococcales archaeon]|nr:hypothetical protein [Desulfurococcales archaeon]
MTLDEVDKYKRVLLYPDPRNTYDAARFLVYSLLISNNARRDTLAQVRIGAKWIIAPGDKIRHLRPDADTSEGWVRAVLRGKKLGALLSENPLIPEKGVKIEIRHARTGSQKLYITRMEPPVVACLHRGVECELGEDLFYEVRNWGVWRTTVILNIILDRIWSGLPPVRC